MTNITDTFGAWTDTGQTTLQGSTITFTHNTDLSDNDQTYTFYVGSNNSNRIAYANSDPGVDNITVSVTDNTSEWTASTAYSLGDFVQPTGGGNGYIYKCTTAGTSDSSEPTWPTTGIQTSTVTDGTAVWTLWSAHHETTEIKLSDDGVTYGAAGASLSLGTSISGGSGNQKAVYVKVTNAVTNVSDNTGHTEVRLSINAIREEEA